MWKSTLTKIFPRGTAAFHKTLPALDKGKLPKEVKPNNAVKKHDTDLLLNQIKYADSPSSIFQITSLHQPVMNNVHLEASFKALFKIVRTYPGLQSEIAEHSEFKTLCNSTYKKVRYLKNYEIISILKTLNFLGISSRTSLYQALCQMLKSNINDLNLNQIIFLFTILRNTDSTPIVDALRIALPIVLQTVLEYQLDIENPNQVAICFGIATEHNLPSEAIKRLALEVNKNISCLDLHHSLICLKGASLFFPRNRTHSDIKALLEPLSNRIVEHSSELTKPQIMLVIGSLRRLSFFPNDLMEILYQRITSHFDGKLFQPLLACLMRTGSLTDERMEKISTLILQNKLEVMSNPSLHGYLLEAFTEIEFPIGPELKELFCEYTELLKNAQMSELNISPLNLNPMSYLRRLKGLACLSCLKKELLQHPFSKEFVTSLFSITSGELRAKTLYELLQLYWVVKTTAEDEPLFSPDDLRAVVEAFSEFNLPEVDLSPQLTLGLGGQQFFRKDIYSPLGHPIDYLIVMRKGRFPMPLKSSSAREMDEDSSDCDAPISSLFDNIVMPDQARKIAIILDRKTDYQLESHLPKSKLRLKLQTLEKIGYCPLLVNSVAFDELLEKEKIPYLMKEINETFEKSYEGILDSSEIPV